MNCKNPLMFLTKLPIELFLKIILYIDPDVFINTYIVSREIKHDNCLFDRLEANKNFICKRYLYKYKVNFWDPTNFIYLSDTVNLNRSLNLSLFDVLKLYCVHFNDTVINCNDMGITSFPVYPKMSLFIGNNNNIKVFPQQPGMILFIGEHNKLEHFEVQPVMLRFVGNDNCLKYFPVQPNMTHFYGVNNNIVNFPKQPKMEEFKGDHIPNFK